MDGPLPFGGMLTCRQAFAAIPFCSAPKRTRLPTMSTIEFVDPELRDALALRPRSIASSIGPNRYSYGVAVTKSRTRPATVAGCSR
jgi:hypothetical protein